MKVYPLALLLVLLVLSMTGCTKELEQPKRPEPPSLVPGAEATPSAVAGIRWTVPERWSGHPPRQMRVATYMIPPAEGDDEGGECAVFHFPGGQGGDLESNINRWLGQFENIDTPVRDTRKVNGLSVTTIAVGGTYLSPGGPMMQSQGKKENYRLLGAIVEAPEGLVFFKLTGPARTIAAAGKEFETLVGSVTGS